MAATIFPDRLAADGRRYPALYFLHDIGGGDTDIRTVKNLAALANELGLFFICPNTMHSYGMDLQCGGAYSAYWHADNHPEHFQGCVLINGHCDIAALCDAAVTGRLIPDTLTAADLQAAFGEMKAVRGSKYDILCPENPAPQNVFMGCDEDSHGISVSADFAKQKQGESEMSTAKNMDALLQGFVDGGLPGCGLKITRRGEAVYEGYFGKADRETGAPVTRASVFRQASTSKLPLYTAAMMLYEQGKFLMTDPLYEFLPEYRESTKVVRRPGGSVEIVKTDRPIIIRDILSMRCGLPYCNFAAETNDVTLREMMKAMTPLWEKGHYTNREQVRAMAAVPLAFEPGTHWLYGFGSELTCALVEAVTGKSVDDALEEMLFAPLEMHDTRSHFFGDIEQRMVKLYAMDQNKTLSPVRLDFERTFLPGAENEAGWARLFSTVSDYSNLMQMLACGGTFKGERVIGRKTIDLIRTNVLTPHQMQDYQNPYEAGYGYGYGFRTLIDRAAGDVNGSPGVFGWTGGYGSWCESDPEEQVSVVYMHNLVPNGERYYHPRVRAAAYGMIE